MNIERHRGAFTVEVAMGLPILLMFVFGWIEVCLMTFNVSMTDHALTTAVMRTKKAGDSSGRDTVNYRQQIKDELTKTGGYLWGRGVKPGSVKIDVDYFRDFGGFLKCTDEYSSAAECPERRDEPENMTLAVYSLEYVYNPLSSIWFPEATINREIITIQEYERCSFKIGKGAGCAK